MVVVWIALGIVYSLHTTDFQTLRQARAPAPGQRPRQRAAADLKNDDPTPEDSRVNMAAARNTLEFQSGRQKHSGVCLAAAKPALESVWRPPD
ncbi:hypothetical protein PoB_001443400 [Plakobranchus ocellatus]|uniref:Uncharacterized protein n=1 Tax=Plakobranchus ocellatus TaxID=259542 RepID=A0AAV3YY09_9GAST|nr:hypothetical protein PoB_001443400 [Plakobranchus ocellatus]